jgi:hypothetical protein
MNANILRFYKQHRAHQMAIANDGGGTMVTYADSGKVELSYASAPYGKHALSALNSARRSIHFIADLEKTVAASKKRSKEKKK